MSTSDENNLAAVASINASTSSLTVPISTSPPLTVAIDTPCILRSIQMLNIRVITKHPDGLDSYARLIQSTTWIPLKGMSIKCAQKLCELSKSDYSVFLKHEKCYFTDQSAYSNFIPSLKPLIEISLEKCSYSTNKVKEQIKDWEALQSEIPVRRLILVESEISHSHPNISFIPKSSSSVDSILQEAVRDLISHFEEKMSDIEHKEIIESPKSLDDNLPKQVRHRLKSRAKGRSFKLLADIYLLFGLYQEALPLFNKAIEDCKLNSDIIWQVAAQEGQAVASFVKSVFSEDARKPKFVKQAAEGLCSKLHDLSSGYEKAALPFLAFQAILQASRVYRALGMTTEYHYYLSSTRELLPSMSGDEFEFALSLIMQCYEESGLRRKKAVLAHQLAQHFFSYGRVPLAVSIIESCCFPQMGIKRENETNWSRLAYHLTKSSLDMVKGTQDRSLQLLYSLLHLKYGCTFLGEKQQKEIFGSSEALSKDLPILEPRSITPLCCLKIVCSAEVTSGLVFITPTRSNAFLNDIRRVGEEKRKGVILANQAFSVTVDFFNPSSCDLLVKDFTLIGSEAFVCESHSFELAFSSKHTVVLNASVSGDVDILMITGASYSLFNISFQEDVTMSPIKVFPEQPFIKITDSSIKSGCLSLYEGERSKLTLTLVNTSQRRALKLSVIAKPELIGEGRSKNSMLFRKQEDPIIKCVCEKQNLEAGEECSVEVELAAVLGLEALEVVVGYEGDEPSIPRTTRHSLIVSVLETFSVDGIAMFPSDPFGKFEGSVLAFTLTTFSFDPLLISIIHEESQVIEYSSHGEEAKKISIPISLLGYPSSFQEAVKDLELDDNRSAFLNKMKHKEGFSLETFWATCIILSQLQVNWAIPEQARSGVFDIEEWQIAKHHLPLIYRPLFAITAEKDHQQRLQVCVEGRTLVRVQFYDHNSVSLYSSVEDTVYYELQDECKSYLLPSQAFERILICGTCPITRRNQFVEIKN